MTYDKSSGALVATPTEIIGILSDRIFTQPVNAAHTQTQVDMLTQYGAKITAGQNNWLLKTRIQYLNSRKSSNQLNSLTQGNPVNHLVLID